MPIRPRDQHEAARIDAALATFHADVRALPGIQQQTRREVYLHQFFDSMHRLQYIERGILAPARNNALDPRRCDPNHLLFDPLKAAALRNAQGQHDEACWLVFYFTHFGKHLHDEYRLARDIYGCLGSGTRWDWARTSADPAAFRTWLGANLATLRSGNPTRRFGNHRRYVSLSQHSNGGTGHAFGSYVNWVLAHGNHQRLFAHAAGPPPQDRRRTFANLYDSMSMVASFARLAKFDYLCMIGKLGLADIRPGSPCLSGATGPLRGARLLFGTPQATARQLDEWLIQLEAHLAVPMGMQVLEDSLCNWQKNPEQYEWFRG